MSARRGVALTLNAPESAQALAARLGQSMDSLRLLTPLPDMLDAGTEVFLPR